VVLVGAAAEAPASDLGWIVCGAASGPKAARARRVESFMEKPDSDTALKLHRDGTLCNTLVIAALGRALWSLAEQHVPTVVAISMIDAGWSDCGTPDRLFQALEKGGELTKLLARLAGHFSGEQPLVASA
jgi:hypothetical protein